MPVAHTILEYASWEEAHAGRVDRFTPYCARLEKKL